MNGLHLTADLRDCGGMGLLSDPAVFAPLALGLCTAAGLSVVSSHWHRFGVDAGSEADGSGFTGVLLLAESHLAVHTWPEFCGVTLDVYVCNHSGDNTLKARALMDALVARFEPGRVSRHELQRGFA